MNPVSLQAPHLPPISSEIKAKGSLKSLIKTKQTSSFFSLKCLAIISALGLSMAALKFYLNVDQVSFYKPMAPTSDSLGFSNTKEVATSINSAMQSINASAFNLGSQIPDFLKPSYPITSIIPPTLQTTDVNETLASEKLNVSLREAIAESGKEPGLLSSVLAQTNSSVASLNQPPITESQQSRQTQDAPLSQQQNKSIQLKKNKEGSNPNSLNVGTYYDPSYLMIIKESDSSYWDQQPLAALSALAAHITGWASYYFIDTMAPQHHQLNRRLSLALGSVAGLTSLWYLKP